MLNNILDQKTALARLLATEKLTVRYSTKYPTAYFDLTERAIHIPLLPNLDEDILDLFEGHEVGHALETPADGFHSAIQTNGKYDMTMKSYLNVIEDIRIERKIKDKYPGLRRSFANAYKKLVERNFFGQNLTTAIKTYDFIDRLNIEAKVGAYVIVDFTDEEKVLVEEAFSLNTWDEVVAFARKLIARQAKLNKALKKVGQQAQQPLSPSQRNPQDLPESNEDDTIVSRPEPQSKANESEDEESEADDGESGTLPNQGNMPDAADENENEEDDASNNGDESSSAPAADKNSDEDSDEESSGGSSDEYSDEESSGGSSDEGPDSETEDGEVAPSQTDTTFRDKEGEMYNAAQLQREKYGQPAAINIPKYNLKEYVVPASVHAPKLAHDVQQMFNRAASEGRYTNRNGFTMAFQPTYKTFDDYINFMRNRHRDDNSQYINFLIKEFEVRKNARLLNRGKVAKTGKLDVQRLYKYRLTNDVFKRVMSFPEGKNHGMIMYMDLSGSMTDSISGVFNQVLILSEFCKKVGIPFRVYGFNDSEHSLNYIRSKIDNNFGRDRKKVIGEFAMENEFHLKEYISSELSAHDYKLAFNNILMLKWIWNRAAFRGRYYSTNVSGDNKITKDLSDVISLHQVGEALGGTPLNKAIILSQQINNEFVAKYSIENMVNIVLTDGEDEFRDSIPYHNLVEREGREPCMEVTELDRESSHQSMICHHSGKRYVIMPRHARTQFSTYHMLKFARKITGARYIGYYLVPPARSHTQQFLSSVVGIESDSHFRDTGTRDRAGSFRYIARHKEIRTQFKENKFYMTKCFGHNEYFFISTSDTIDGEDDGNWFKTAKQNYEGVVTKGALSKAFIEKQTKRQLNKILLVNLSKVIAEAV